PHKRWASIGGNTSALPVLQGRRRSRRAPKTPRSAGHRPLALLLGRLAVDAQRGHRAGLQPLDADRLAALLAQAEGAVIDARQRLVDLADQLALAVADAQQEIAIALQAAAVRGIGEALDVVTHVLRSAAGVVQQGSAATVQQIAEEVEIVLI